MSRSKWKGPFIDLTKLLSKNYVNIISRNCEITPEFLGLTFKIYNGKNFKEIVVIEDMISHKFGEFFFTRAKFVFKKKKLKKKIKK